MTDTSETLLDRLKVENAHDAWKEFYHLYWGAIIRYARKLGLSETNAHDVLQETMVTLIRLLPEFAYDRRRGKFRNFLLTIVHRKSLATMRRAARRAEDPLQDSHEPDSTDHLENDLQAEREAETRWRESLLEEAIRRVREDASLAENTFAVFEAYTIRHQSAEEVARKFGLKENAVYQIKNRILRRIELEVAALIRNSGGDGADR